MKKTKILQIIFISVILVSFSFNVFAENEIANNEEAQNNTETENKSLLEQSVELQDKLKESNSRLEYVEGELSASLQKIQELDDIIRENEKKYENLNIQIQQMELEVSTRQKEIDNIQEKYNRKQQLLKKRLVAMYEAGSTSYLDVLLKSKNIFDFLSNYYMLEQIVEFDNQLLDDLEKQKSELEEEKVQQEDIETELKASKLELSRTQILMQNNRILQENYIMTLSNEEKELQQKIEEYKNEQEEINKKIQEAIAWSGNLQITYNGGLMIWPVGVAGTYITSGYGYRLHPIQGIYKYHAGIDIGNAGYGTPVLAAADGVVIYAGAMSGYGNCVMINHGNNIVTLYGHGQTILTELGKEVKQGDVIMAVGSTGNSTGPHLHFEVRIEGKTVDPIPYLDGTVSKLKDEYSNDYD